MRRTRSPHPEAQHPKAPHPEDRTFSVGFVTALMLGAALNPVNTSIIPTALAPISHDFGVAPGRAAVLVSVLYLACAVAQPTAGTLAEQLGPRRVFLTGSVIVLAGGLLGGLSPDFTGLIIARILIGLGTSAGYPSAMVMVRRRADDAGLDAPPGAVLAGLAIVGLSLIAVGPPIGGVLVEMFGWRSTFFVNVPVAIAAFLCGLGALPRDAAVDRGGEPGILVRIDLPGIVGFALTMIALLIFLLSIPAPEWVALLIAVLVGVLFVWWELRASPPFFDVRELISNGALTRTYLRTTMMMIGSYVVLYGLPQWLQDAHGYGSSAAGLIIVPMGVVAAFVSLRVSRHNLVRSSMVAAGGAMIVGGTLMAVLGAGQLPLLALVVSLLFGVTIGGCMSGSQLALYAQAAPGRIGSASGLLRTFTYLGSIGASVISGVVFQREVTDPGLHLMGWIVAALGMVVVVMAVADRSLKPAGSCAPSPPSL